jgi:glutaredoxin
MFLARLLRRVRRRPDLHFTLFTRHGCHLCDDAEAILRRQQARYGFNLDSNLVDDKPEWIEQYGDCVPVVLVNGKVRFRGHVNEVLLQRILDADG